jgi:osmotically-inducible protein OsmY
MEMLALEKKIRARLLDNHIDLSTLNIEVVEKNTVQISGMAFSEADKERLPHILKKIQGVESVDIEVSVWSQSFIG